MYHMELNILGRPVLYFIIKQVVSEDKTLQHISIVNMH